MFKCERCGSRYSAMHAVTMENCPRCLIRDRTSTPLTFKAFQLPARAEANVPSQSSSRPAGQDRPVSVYDVTA